MRGGQEVVHSEERREDDEDKGLWGSVASCPFADLGTAAICAFSTSLLVPPVAHVQSTFSLGVMKSRAGTRPCRGEHAVTGRVSLMIGPDPEKVSCLRTLRLVVERSDRSISTRS